jgi:hypothetical protein
MGLHEEIQRQLKHPDLEGRISDYIVSSCPKPLRDHILFAEYLERKHGVGFVVYAKSDTFEVVNYQEWLERIEKTPDLISHWRTKSCPQPTRHRSTLLVGRKLAEILERHCRVPDASLARGIAIFDCEALFDDKHRMVVQVCTSGNPAEESCWAQGILFSPEGWELCSMVSERFLGEYSISYGERDYVVFVRSLPPEGGQSCDDQSTEQAD